MKMWRQKVRDIHLAFSSSDRILGSGAVHWPRVWSFQWKASDLSLSETEEPAAAAG